MSIRNNLFIFEVGLRFATYTLLSLDLTLWDYTGYVVVSELFGFVIHLSQAKGVESFKEFYQKKTKHRKLTWIFSLGQCNLNGKFEEKTIELILGTYQVIVLSRI